MIDGTDLAKALDICANRVYAEILVAYLKAMEEEEATCLKIESKTHAAAK